MKRTSRSSWNCAISFECVREQTPIVSGESAKRALDLAFEITRQIQAGQLDNRMGGLFLIVPVVAFDIWLSCTTGRRQLPQWAVRGQWRPIGLVAVRRPAAGGLADVFCPI